MRVGGVWCTEVKSVRLEARVLLSLRFLKEGQALLPCKQAMPLSRQVQNATKSWNEGQSCSGVYAGGDVGGGDDQLVE